jgi:ABC-type amino acid transport substrate-binding protein
MKRFLAIILAGLMLLSLASCGEKKNENVVKIGVLEMDMEGLHGHIRTEHPDSNSSRSAISEPVYYDNLSAALMDLNSGKIDRFVPSEVTADYIVAHNENLTKVSFEPQNTTHPTLMNNFHMMTMDTNKEVYDILNNAIVDMKADGTLDSLIENELKAYIENDPEPKDLPHFDGAITIKVGVTGDIPPMDYVASNGKAAGFNIALLTEIANRAQVNFELVQIETGARAMALSSGKVDALFWSKSFVCSECNEKWIEQPAGTIVTENYFADHGAVVVLKADK